MAALGQTVLDRLSSPRTSGTKSSATSHLPQPGGHVTWLSPQKPQWTNHSYGALLREGDGNPLRLNA